MAEGIRPPRLFIIGAPKCGTTTLFNALAKVSGTVPSAVKEPNFFEYDRNYQRGPQAYLDLFDYPETDAHLVGLEATPWYLYSQQAADRMRGFIDGEVRLVVCVRDPLERAISHYRDFWGGGREQRSFRDAIEEELEQIGPSRPVLRGRETGYLSAGFYHSASLIWSERFGGDSLRFIALEQLRDELVSVVDELLTWNGLPATVTDLRIGASETNPASVVRSRRLNDLTLALGRSSLGRGVRGLMPWQVETRLAGALQRVMRTSTDVSPVDEGDREWLHERVGDLFRSEVESLHDAGVAAAAGWPSAT